MIVLDASVVVELVVGTSEGLRLLEDIRSADAILAAPELVDVEVLQVLRRMVYRGDIEAVHAEASIGLLGDLPLTRYGHAALRDRVWEFRHAMTAYDAVYVALAERLEASLWTRDTKLASSSVEADIVVV